MFAPLPDSWRKQGGDVQSKLTLGLLDKWQNLEELSGALGLPDASVESFKAESTAVVGNATALKALVDALISLRTAGTR